MLLFRTSWETFFWGIVHCLHFHILYWRARLCSQYLKFNSCRSAMISSFLSLPYPKLWTLEPPHWFFSILCPFSAFRYIFRTFLVAYKIRGDNVKVSCTENSVIFSVCHLFSPCHHYTNLSGFPPEVVAYKPVCFF